MKRKAFLAASALVAGTLAPLTVAATPAWAAGPGNCTTAHDGPTASVTCSGVYPGTVWRATDVCVHYEDGRPMEYRAYGNQVTGNGTSNLLCGPAAYATDNVETQILQDARPHYEIVGYGGKCLDVEHGDSGNSTAVQMYHCNGTDAQQWTLQEDGTIRALGKCLNVEWAATANRSLVEIYSCNGGPAEQWKHRTDGSLYNPHSGRCLDVLGFNTADGARPGLWDCDGLANQKWQLVS
jgi:hypothetical protein